MHAEDKTDNTFLAVQFSSGFGYVYEFFFIITKKCFVSVVFLFRQFELIFPPFLLRKSRKTAASNKNYSISVANCRPAKERVSKTGLPVILADLDSHCCRLKMYNSAKKLMYTYNSVAYLENNKVNCSFLALYFF